MCTNIYLQGKDLEDIKLNIKIKNDCLNNLELELFQEPEKNLYQRNAIRIENIENNNKYIIKKITNISQKIETANLEKRDEFLYIV